MPVCNPLHSLTPT